MHPQIRRLKMSKVHRDEQIVIRVATPLKRELEAAAAADEHDLSGLVRKVLIDFAAKRIVLRESAAAGVPR
jgi:hypothetical protein